MVKPIGRQLKGLGDVRRGDDHGRRSGLADPRRRRPRPGPRHRRLGRGRAGDQDRPRRPLGPAACSRSARAGVPPCRCRRSRGSRSSPSTQIERSGPLGGRAVPRRDPAAGPARVRHRPARDRRRPRPALGHRPRVGGASRGHRHRPGARRGRDDGDAQRGRAADPACSARPSSRTTSPTWSTSTPSSPSPAWRWGPHEPLGAEPLHDRGEPRGGPVLHLLGGRSVLRRRRRWTCRRCCATSDMTVVPRAPESVHGLINLRGQIVTAIDLRTRLGLPPRPEDQLPMNVVAAQPRRGRQPAGRRHRRRHRHRRASPSSPPPRPCHATCRERPSRRPAPARRDPARRRPRPRR